MWKTYVEAEKRELSETIPGEGENIEDTGSATYWVYMYYSPANLPIGLRETGKHGQEFVQERGQYY